MESKKCYVCKEVLPLSDFSIKQQKYKNGKCKRCENICNKVLQGTVTKEERAFLKLHNYRVRFGIPAYRKCYSVYQIDDIKSHEIQKKLQQLAYKLGNKSIVFRVMPTRIQKLCYIKDENNQPIHKGDEKHIYRYKALQSVLENIAKILLKEYKLLLNIDVMRYLYIKTNILFYSDKVYQAELMDTWNKPIKTRLKANITLLKCLKTGMEIEDAAAFAKKLI